MAESVKKKVVGKRQYPDSVIEMCLLVHFMYRLPLRQVQGYVRDLLDKMGYWTLPVPDYSTICRRQGDIFVGQSFDDEGTGNIHIALDSTGLKVYGEGEWKVRQHGYGKHRTWMKLHIAIDVVTQRIVAAILTDNSQHDGTVAIDLLTGKVEKLASFRGDGAYDSFGLREVLGENTVQIIPPPENAILQPDTIKSPLPAHLKQRNDAVQAIEEKGRVEWKKESGYHLRSLNEVVMFRYKNTFGDRLQARKFENQLTEVLLKCKVLNIFVETGLPVSVLAA
jgi:Transposase DDE domain